MTTPTDPIAVLAISPARRLFGAIVWGGLGGVLIYAAGSLDNAPALYVACLIGVGLLALWQSVRFFQTGPQGLFLTSEGVTSIDGQMVAEIDNIATVERGLLAFKPSNGFLIRLKAPRPRGWVPGLWWRLGTRIGVGGATPARDAKAMADILTAMILDPEVRARYQDQSGDSD